VLSLFFLCAFAQLALASSQGCATIDGDVSEWKTYDGTLEMWEAGNPDKKNPVLLADVYYKVKCAPGVTVPSVPNCQNPAYFSFYVQKAVSLQIDVDQPDDHWVKFYNIKSSAWVYGREGSNAEVGSMFKWVGEPTSGYEMQALTCIDDELNWEIHLNIAGRTSSSGKRTVFQSFTCNNDCGTTQAPSPSSLKIESIAPTPEPTSTEPTPAPTPAPTAPPTSQECEIFATKVNMESTGWSFDWDQYSVIPVYQSSGKGAAERTEARDVYCEGVPDEAWCGVKIPRTLCQLSGMADPDRKDISWQSSSLQQCEGTSPEVCQVYQKYNRNGINQEVGTCASFCDYFGLTCLDGWDDRNNCMVGGRGNIGCNERQQGSSDHICKCGKTGGEPQADTKNTISRTFDDVYDVEITFGVSDYNTVDETFSLYKNQILIGTASKGKPVTKSFVAKPGDKIELVDTTPGQPSIGVVGFISKFCATRAIGRAYAGYCDAVNNELYVCGTEVTQCDGENRCKKFNGLTGFKPSETGPSCPNVVQGVANVPGQGMWSITATGLRLTSEDRTRVSNFPWCCQCQL